MNMLERYERAKEIFLTANEKSVLNETISERFCTGSDDFWYARDMDEEGKIVTKFTRYIAAENKQAQLFCHEKMAELIEPFCEKKPEKHKLPIEIFEVDDSEKKIYLSVTGYAGEFAYDLETGELTRPNYAFHDKSVVTSPDRKVSIFTKEYDLYMRCNDTGKETRLTFDGEANLQYGIGWHPVSWKLLGRPPVSSAPAIVFSPDSKRFATFRNDTRLQKRMNLIQSVPLGDDPRPVHVSYPYPIPGDEDTYSADVYLCDVESKKMTKVRFEDGTNLELLADSMFSTNSKQFKWTKDGSEAFLLRYDRLFKNAKCIVIDGEKALARTVTEDFYETSGFTSWYGSAGQESFSEPNIAYLQKTREVIWHSEAEGRSALYLVDIDKGARRRLTLLSSTMRRLRFVDEENRIAYYSASDIDENIDPYFQFLHSVNLDSGEITRLSREPLDHVSRFAPSGKYYINSCSAIDTAPHHTVNSVDGNEIFVIADADISKIVEKGFTPAEPFEALARDGKTKIYGIILKPADFDPNKKYPVIHYTYGGQQRIVVPKSFQWAGLYPADPQYGIQSARQLGFVSIIVDGFSTPLRTKEMHDVGYGHTEECCGLEDDVCAIKQLGEKYPWIDTDRVGIWGASGGGYATVRAMMQFPEFYKVGVSLCGNHDQAIYNAQWGNRWMGAYDKEGWQCQANYSMADKLEGKLLIVHGDLDDNVHPSASIRLVHQLIEENKDFEFLYYPNADHALNRYPYITRRRWDFFVTHLLGETPPKGFTLVQKKDEEEK